MSTKAELTREDPNDALPSLEEAAALRADGERYRNHTIRVFTRALRAHVAATSVRTVSRQLADTEWPLSEARIYKILEHRPVGA